MIDAALDINSRNKKYFIVMLLKSTLPMKLYPLKCMRRKRVNQ